MYVLFRLLFGRHDVNHFSSVMKKVDMFLKSICFVLISPKRRPSLSTLSQDFQSVSLAFPPTFFMRGPPHYYCCSTTSEVSFRLTFFFFSPKKSSWCSFVISLRCPGALGSWIVTPQVPDVIMWNELPGFPCCTIGWW